MKEASARPPGFALSVLSSIRQVDMAAPALEETAAILPEHDGSTVRASLTASRALGGATGVESPGLAPVVRP